MAATQTKLNIQRVFFVASVTSHWFAPLSAHGFEPMSTVPNVAEGLYDTIARGGEKAKRQKWGAGLVSLCASAFRLPHPFSPIPLRRGQELGI